jgi:hypothetical protein
MIILPPQDQDATSIATNRKRGRLVAFASGIGITLLLAGYAQFVDVGNPPPYPSDSFDVSDAWTLCLLGLLPIGIWLLAEPAPGKHRILKTAFAGALVLVPVVVVGAVLLGGRPHDLSDEAIRAFRERSAAVAKGEIGSPQIENRFGYLYAVCAKVSRTRDLTSDRKLCMDVDLASETSVLGGYTMNDGYTSGCFGSYVDTCGILRGWRYP